jgi:magnesium chelatase subunit D
MTQTQMNHQAYPFTALVGQDDLKLALLLAAVNPSIAGVLVRGERGTAKSTAVRSFAELLPPQSVRSGCPCNCAPDDPPLAWQIADYGQAESSAQATVAAVPFVELPLGATEDRIVGTVDLERALQEGKQIFQPGLLAAANRGILYVDEVNLLADHLVDLLLDAAASGVNVVRREGFDVTHPARFLLVGTMNPEEGNLRPQLLDRFTLLVDVSGPTDATLRAEIVRRRFAFDQDPVGFAARYAHEQTSLRDRIVSARERLRGVAVPDIVLAEIVQVCLAARVEGVRADLGLHQSVRALAALEERDSCCVDDVHRVMRFVIPHRQRRSPTGAPPLPAPSNQQSSAERENRNRAPGDPEDALRGNVDDCGGSNGSGTDTSDSTASHETEGHVYEPLQGITSPSIHIGAAGSQSANELPRGRRVTMPTGGAGRTVSAVMDPGARDIAVVPTLRTAAARGRVEDGRLSIDRSDLHRKVRESRVGALLLFVVDASGSMAARQRMEAVKGAVMALLADAYHQRDRVAVIVFRGPEAQVLLNPTSSIENAREALRTLPTGGRTPLAHAFVLAGELIDRHRAAQPLPPVLTIVLTDGKANVAIPATEANPWNQALEAAAALRGVESAFVVLDTENDFIRHGRARRLAGELGAEYVPLDELSVGSLVLEVGNRRGRARQTSRSTSR